MCVLWARDIGARARSSNCKGNHTGGELMRDLSMGLRGYPQPQMLWPTSSILSVKMFGDLQAEMRCLVLWGQRRPLWVVWITNTEWCHVKASLIPSPHHRNLLSALGWSWLVLLLPCKEAEICHMVWALRKQKEVRNSWAFPEDHPRGFKYGCCFFFLSGVGIKEERRLEPIGS